MAAAMNQGRRVIRRAGTVLALGALLGTAATGPGVLAHAAHGHPAKIHQGTCDDYGAVAFPLNGVGGEVDLSGAPVKPVTAVNERNAYQVLYSETEIATTLDDLLAEPRALVVYASDDDLSAMSCGNLGGARIGDELAVGLAESGMPGHSGIAVLDPDGDQTEVKIYLGHALAPVSAQQGGAAHDDDHDDGGPATPTDHDDSGDHADA
ncbi:MAG: hypothetical protein IT337_01510 [Thermomicrobiales bacterium]|nr:hypothetical protein [Thermomicrobiales bacterium]